MNYFTLLSKDIKGQLDSKYAYEVGDNRSPSLSWEYPPNNTKSFAVTVYDPDAPTTSGWWHWQIININKDIRELPRNLKISNSLDVIQSRNDYGFFGYGGANPPKGDKAHSYIFTIHALDIDRLEYNNTVSASALGGLINNHTIQKASIITYFQNK